MERRFRAVAVLDCDLGVGVLGGALAEAPVCVIFVVVSAAVAGSYFGLSFFSLLFLLLSVLLMVIL